MSPPNASAPPSASADGAHPARAPRPVRALLFDKDGTLFGFQATWGGWTAELIAGLAPEDPRRRARLAEAIGFDAAGRRFQPDSPVIAGTLDELMGLWLPLLPGWDATRLTTHLIDQSRSVRPVEAVPLAPLLARLAQAGLALGVATNDAEEPARVQLDVAGVGAAFAFVAGADSGHGAKPGPGQCLAFASHAGLAPAEIAMVGDTTHDLAAARAAGMLRVAVLTGVARHEDLAAEADVVLPDIGHLPDWLGL